MQFVSDLLVVFAVRAKSQKIDLYCLLQMNDFETCNFDVKEGCKIGDVRG